VRRDWSASGSLDDFFARSPTGTDWLDVAELIRSTETVLASGWSTRIRCRAGAGRVTQLGDAAHPMVPRGSNGAGRRSSTRLLADCPRRAVGAEALPRTTHS
jgi:2-polyprenyl-6-methoxyphenol hydroxylase-like FAD-dependent oxidoreductase